MSTPDNKPFNRLWVGMLLGVAGTFAGGLMLGTWWALSNGTTLDYFYNVVFRGSLLYRDSILTAATLLNVLLFWVANRRDHDRLAMGLLGIILLTVPVIVYFQFVAGTL